MPEDFKKTGPELLKSMRAIAENAAHPEQVRALIWCLERIYGKAPQGIEIETSDTVNTVLARIYAGKAKDGGG